MTIIYPVKEKTLLGCEEWQPIEKIESSSLNLTDFIKSGDRSSPWCRYRETSGEIAPEDNPNTLGLHWQLKQGKGLTICPSYFVGAVWLDAYLLNVQPKVSDLDIASMLTSVLAAPTSVTGVEPGMLFGCNPEDKKIEGKCTHDLTILVVITYLCLLARFVQRQLRPGFNRISENLVGKVKGKINLSEHLRENLARGRDDRAHCNFTVLNLNTLENRILKSALTTCSHWLNNQKLNPKQLQTIIQWLGMSHSALASVPDVRPTTRDWNNIRKTGLMSAYAEPLAFAKMVLIRLHIDVEGKIQESNFYYPFFLDMNRLFEAWVGVCLQYIGSKPLAQYSTKLKLGNSEFSFRPDFVVNNSIVVDAKYKRITSQKKIENTDVYQVLAYARLLSLQPNIGCNESWLFYPKIPTTSDPLNDFNISWKSKNPDWKWPDGSKFGILEVPLPKK